MWNALTKSLDTSLKSFGINANTNVTGLARTLLALSTLLTLTFNDTGILFTATVESNPPYCTGPSVISIFCLFAPHYELARFVAIFILVLVASGWRPQITCLFHAWVAFSLKASSSILEGGDQVASILTLLLLPICLTDKRTWHWERSTSTSTATSVFQELTYFVHASALLVIRLQIAYLYFDASIKKFHVVEWLNGTALYYWISNSYFGANDIGRSILMPLVLNPIIVSLMTWSVLVFEVFLFTAIVVPEKYRRPLLILGIAFHFMIGIIHGLMPFFFSMCGALVLYLRPINAEFNFRPFRSRPKETSHALNSVYIKNE
ncbi:MAG: hypothetical protein HOP08_08095 [Cyclobacteriaceae bacterium]|nr:hypothetical protein [Cyclobacteriaceae bacterium]